MRVVGRHLGSLGISLIDMLVVVMGLGTLLLLGVGCPIDEKGFVAFGVDLLVLGSPLVLVLLLQIIIRRVELCGR